MSEELRRRFLHMDGGHSDSEREEVVSDFLQKLVDSGYSHPTRMEIIKSAARRFFQQLMDQEAGGSRLYRSSEEMAKSRKLNELVNKTWYKSKAGLLVSRIWRGETQEQQK